MDNSKVVFCLTAMMNTQLLVLMSPMPHLKSSALTPFNSASFSSVSGVPLSPSMSSPPSSSLPSNSSAAGFTKSSPGGS